MTILKYMTADELVTRLSDIRVQLEKVDARRRNPPPYTYYNPRADLALAKELHEYMDELNAELASRST